MYFYLFTDKQMQWRWNIHADNHKVIATGAEGYLNRADCLHGINLVKANAAKMPILDGQAAKWL